MKNRTKAELLLFSCTVIWGGTFVVVKEGLADCSPLMFVALRFIIATVLCLPFVLRTLPSMSRASFHGGIVIGIFLFLGFATQTVGLAYTTASKSGFITGLLVIFTPIFQILIERKPPKAGNILGIVLVTAGLYFLTSPEGSEFTLGDGLTLVCAAMFGLYIVFLDIYSREGNPWHMNVLQFGVTAVGATLCAFLFEDITVVWSTGFVQALTYLALLATLYTMTIQVRFQKETTPTRAAIIFSIEPVFAAMFAFIFLGERIGMAGVMGGSLVVGGILVSELSDVVMKPKRTTAEQP